MSANSGYGICGAINVYSSSAKLGNWVEDEAGQALASQARPAIGSYASNTRSSFIDPKDMIPHPSMTQVKMMSTAELKAKNKEGTSYSMLFNHGHSVPHNIRYKTANREHFTEGMEFARKEHGLKKSMEKVAAREFKAQYDMASQTKMMNSYATNDNQNYKPNAVNGVHQRMPNWKRRSILMQTE